jgi:hypothetical protein
MAAAGARSGVALGGDVHERLDRERGHQPARLAGRIQVEQLGLQLSLLRQWANG